MKNLEVLAIQENNNGKYIIQQQLGRIRSVAAELKYEDPTIDEQKVFDNLVASFLRGIKTETSKIFGSEETAQLFNLWPVRKN